MRNYDVVERGISLAKTCQTYFDNHVTISRTRNLSTSAVRVVQQYSSI